MFFVNLWAFPTKIKSTIGNALYSKQGLFRKLPQVWYNAIKGERSTLSFDSTSTQATVKAELCFVHPELHFENYCAADKHSCEL